MKYITICIFAPIKVYIRCIYICDFKIFTEIIYTIHLYTSYFKFANRCLCGHFKLNPCRIKKFNVLFAKQLHLNFRYQNAEEISN